MLVGGGIDSSALGAINEWNPLMNPNIDAHISNNASVHHGVLSHHNSDGNNYFAGSAGASSSYDLRL
jgi:hypothetical protein